MQTLPPPEETNRSEKPVWYPEQQDQEVVIAYTSKHLNGLEAQWATIEKECFAIVHAIEVFRTSNKFVWEKVCCIHRPSTIGMVIRESKHKWKTPEMGT
jgi:hypothetical protein